MRNLQEFQRKNPRAKTRGKCLKSDFLAGEEHALGGVALGADDEVRLLAALNRADHVLHAQRACRIIRCRAHRILLLNAPGEDVEQALIHVRRRAGDRAVGKTRHAVDQLGDLAAKLEAALRETFGIGLSDVTIPESWCTRTEFFCEIASKSGFALRSSHLYLRFA